jgi:acyl carrier protein
MAVSISRALSILNLDEENLSYFGSFPEMPGWDSIMQMQLVVVIESDHGIELSAEEIQDLTPQKLIKLYND